MGSSRFQPGEGPSRGLLRDYEPSDSIRMELFEALVCTHLVWLGGKLRESVGHSEPRDQLQPPGQPGLQLLVLMEGGEDWGERLWKY